MCKEEYEIQGLTCRQTVAGGKRKAIVYFHFSLFIQLIANSNCGAMRVKIIADNDYSSLQVALASVCKGGASLYWVVGQSPTKKRASH